jgi:Mn2+/Fe2+ NRAMP family transporter
MSVHKMRLDNTFGMIFSEFATWSIIVVAATVLHNSGVHDVKTAADAAKALEPLVHSFPNAGLLSKLIFSIGIIGLGLLAIPVLSGSAAYSVAEGFGWKASLNLKLKKAPGFYGVIIAATVVGLILNFIGVDPVKALVFAAVLNGVAAVPLLFLILKIAGDEKIMGEFKSKWLSTTILWITFIAMAAAAVAMFYTILK